MYIVIIESETVRETKCAKSIFQANYFAEGARAHGLHATIFPYEFYSENIA